MISKMMQELDVKGNIMITLKEAYGLIIESFYNEKDPQNLYWFGRDLKVYLFHIREFRNLYLFEFQEEEMLGTNEVSSGVAIVNRDTKEITSDDGLAYIFDDDYKSAKIIMVDEIEEY